MFDLNEELKKLPNKPGVYLMHDKDDTIIYVGKAVILKNRVRSYFRESTKKTLKIQQMVRQIAWFEYVITDSELEALVLENNLIKEHNPKYNTMLKDDKTYPYIEVTVHEQYPRIFLTRKVLKDGGKYYGPFTSAEDVHNTIDLLQKLYKIRMCNSRLSMEKGRECLYYHLGQCDAPCIGGISYEDYRRNVDKAIEFLSGNTKAVLEELTDRMKAESEAMEYEKAAQTRDLIASLKATAQKQKITDVGGENRDIIAMARNEQAVIIQMFYVRGGKMIGKDHFYMKQAAEDSDEDILSAFITQYYAGTPFIPKEIILPTTPTGLDVISEWMDVEKGSKVLFTIPIKGKKEKLMELATENARLHLDQDIEKIERHHAKTAGAVGEIEQLLGISGIKRMEAYDISNISGYESVGSMVVYEDGSPKKNDYRKFRIRSVEGPNDYASMQEVLGRRFRHGIKDKEENNTAGAFVRFPDLILMDGGRGQVNIAQRVLSELGLDIPVCGMVKDDNHRTRGLYFNNVELPIDRNSESFKLITRIQDEAHRFAITFHRNLRSGSQVHSVLDDIPGIGPARRKALMRTFESIADIKNADVDTLRQIPSFNEKAAKEVYDFFHKETDEKGEDV